MMSASPMPGQMLQTPGQANLGHQSPSPAASGAAAEYYQMASSQTHLTPNVQHSPAAASAPLTPPLRPHSVPYTEPPSTAHKGAHDPSAQAQTSAQDLPKDYSIATDPGSPNILVKGSSSGTTKPFYTVMPARDQASSTNGPVPNIVYSHATASGPDATPTLVGKILSFDTNAKEVDLEIHGSQKVMPLHDVQKSGLLVGTHELGRLEWEDGIVGTFVDEGYGGKIGTLKVRSWQDSARDVSLSLHQPPQSRIRLDELVVALLATLTFQQIYASAGPSSPLLSLHPPAQPLRPTSSPSTPTATSRSTSPAPDTTTSRSLFGGSSKKSSSSTTGKVAQAKALAQEIKLGTSAARDSANRIRANSASKSDSGRKSQATAIAKDLKADVSAYRARRREQKNAEVAATGAGVGGGGGAGGGVGAMVSDAQQGYQAYNRVDQVQQVNEQTQQYQDYQDASQMFQQQQQQQQQGGDPTGGGGDPTAGYDYSMDAANGAAGGGDPTGGAAANAGGGGVDPTAGYDYSMEGGGGGGGGDPTGGGGDPTDGAADAAGGGGDGGDGGEGVSEIISGVASLAAAGLV